MRPREVVSYGPILGMLGFVARRRGLPLMPKSNPSRRDIVKAAAALPLVYASPSRAASPPAQAITPALIAAATKEVQLTWYTSADLQLAEKGGKPFEQKLTSIRVHIERDGSERML